MSVHQFRVMLAETRRRNLLGLNSQMVMSGHVGVLEEQLVLLHCRDIASALNKGLSVCILSLRELLIQHGF